MNLKEIQMSSLLYEWGKPAGVLAAGILVLFLVNSFLIGPRLRKLDGIRSELKIVKDHYEQFKNFDELSKKLNQQKEEILNISKNLNEVIVVAEKTEKNALDEIGAICRAANIKFDAINPIQSNKGQTWSINFFAGYAQIYEFFTRLENSFRIESLSISGGEGARHKVDLVISPVSVPDEPVEQSDAKSTIMDLSKKAEEIMYRIESKQAEIGTRHEIRRDPLVFKDNSPKAVAPKKEAPVVQTPKLTIEGIFWDPEIPVVVIEGKALREGESFRDAKIKKINETNIVVQWNSQTFTIKFNKKEFR